MRHAYLFARFALAGLALASVACSTATPPDLAHFKVALVRYVDSQRYARDLDRVAHRAERFLRRQAPRVERPAMVLDIDETSLLNWPYQLESNFCYVSQDFDTWVQRAEAEPVVGVLDLYRSARSLDVSVFFVTGRHENQREATEKNLRAVGFESWEGLDMRPRHDGEKSASVFKAAVRRRITEEGYTVVVNIGDQASDLAGGYAQRTFKLPNPFYEVP